jgi:hypothetical protein
LGAAVRGRPLLSSPNLSSGGGQEGGDGDNESDSMLSATVWCRYCNGHSINSYIACAELSVGLSQSGLSEGEEESEGDDREDEREDAGDGDERGEDGLSKLVGFHGPPIYAQADVSLLTAGDGGGSTAHSTGPLAALSLLAASLYPYGFPTGLPVNVPSAAPTSGGGAGSSLAGALGLGQQTTSAPQGKPADAVLDSLVTITLSETETEILFCMPALRALQDSVEARTVNI